MSSVVISGDSSGSVTLTVPSTAGTNTATLPASTGTVMVSGNMPAFSAYLATNQSITSGSDTKLQINTKVFDTNSNFNTSNYRFTPTVAGYYQINATIAGGTVNYIAAVLYKNGSAYLYSFANSAYGLSAQISSLIYMNGSTDYIELYATCNANTTIYGGSSNTTFNGCLLRAA